LETGEYPYGIKIKKDGQPAETGSTAVVSENVMAGILQRTRQMVEEGLKAMGQGQIGIKPYFDGKVSVCPLCVMHGICRFDHYVNRYRGIGKVSKEEILERLKNNG
jgi:ATP-dependent helicase/DNAse subunit B